MKMAIEGTLGPSPRMVLNESNANEWSAMNEGEQISYLRHWPAVRQPHTTTRRMATTIRRQNKRFQAEKFFLPWFSFCFILLKKRERAEAVGDRPGEKISFKRRDLCVPCVSRTPGIRQSSCCCRARLHLSPHRHSRGRLLRFVLRPPLGPLTARFYWLFRT